MKIRIVETEKEKIMNEPDFGLSIFKKIKNLLESNLFDHLKIRKETTLKSNIEQKNNDIVELLNLVEKAKLKIDNFNKELSTLKSENENILTITKTELGII